MKELEKVSPEIIKEVVQQKIVVSKKGTLKKPKGLIYEYDPETQKLCLAEIQESETKGVKPKLITKKDKVYIYALNEKNALRKLTQNKLWFHTLNLVKKAK
jgi:hypothetical protein